MVTIDKIFLGKVAQAKKEQDLTNADLAELTGYKKKTIDAFTCGARDSDAIANSIANVLKIER